MARYKCLGAPETDAKTRKGTKKGYLTAIMYLAPSKEADGVHNLCPFATSGPNGCEEVCLHGAGMAQVFPSIKAARVAKTLPIAWPRSNTGLTLPWYSPVDCRQSGTGIGLSAVTITTFVSWTRKAW